MLANLVYLPRILHDLCRLGNVIWTVPRIPASLVALSPMIRYQIKPRKACGVRPLPHVKSHETSRHSATSLFLILLHLFKSIHLGVHTGQCMILFFLDKGVRDDYAQASLILFIQTSLKLEYLIPITVGLICRLCEWDKHSISTFSSSHLQWIWRPSPATRHLTERSADYSWRSLVWMDERCCKRAAEIVDGSSNYTVLSV